MNIKTVGLQAVPEQSSRIQTELDEVAKFITERVGEFEELSLTLKEVHSGEGHPIHQVIVKVIKGTPIAHTQVEDRNVMKAVNEALTTIKETVAKR